MTYEVELKFPLADSTALEARLASMGAVAESTLEQRDVYFNHPQRDFAQTHEAFRLRTAGDRSYVTYKGPLIDSQTKTRREWELALEDGVMAACKLTEILEMLSFRPLRAISKRRVTYRLPWEGRNFEVVLDEVVGLGNFLEIETLAEEADRDAARDLILRLARELQLEGAERRSYLEMLLEKEGPK
jgi:adenylate cyclase class 2